MRASHFLCPLVFFRVLTSFPRVPFPRQFRPRGGSLRGSVSALIGIRLWSFLSLGHELC